MRGCVWDLPLLSAEAKRYFLPAWLLASIRDPRGSDATDALVFALDGDHRWDPEGGFSEVQPRRHRRYLESMIEPLDDSSGFFWPFLQRALHRWAVAPPTDGNDSRPPTPVRPVRPVEGPAGT
ncbi:MAG: hypothetical protein U0360_01660 [Dehalococcoidia bacterium]